MADLNKDPCYIKKVNNRWIFYFRYCDYDEVEEIYVLSPDYGTQICNMYSQAREAYLTAMQSFKDLELM